MKVRKQARRRFAFRNRYPVWPNCWFNQRREAIAEKFTNVGMSPKEVAKRAADFDAFWDNMVARQAQRYLVEPDPAEEVEAAKQEFVVVKKSTGEVVGTFDMLEDAETVIEKAKRQKKAALMLLDTAA